MKKKSIFIRFAIFFLLFTGLLYLTTEVLKDKRVELEYDVTAKVKGFYAEPKDTLDFVFVDASQLYADIAPHVLFEECGLTAYDFCAHEQPLWISYYYIREALKHQKPKAIILDVFTAYGDTYEENGVNHINLDDLPWNLNKLGAIRNAVPKGSRGEFYFELVQYHDTWDTLDQHKIQNTFYDKKNVYKGYSPFVVRHTYGDEAPKEVTEQKEIAPLPDRAREWLDRIVELTRQEGVDLILIKTPNGNAERQKLYNAVSLYAKEQDVPFVNMNLLFDGEAHLNILQAEKVTRYMGEYLSECYEITDKRQDPAFVSWHEDGRYFYHKKRKCELISTDDAKLYFSLLGESETVKLVAVRSDADSTNAKKSNDAYADGEKCKEKQSRNSDREKQQKLLAELGLKTDENDFLNYVEAELQNGSACYLALIDEQGNVLAQLSDTVACSTMIDYAGHTWELSYDPEGEGRKTVLGIDGDNYSLDHEGINLFSYDTLLEEVVEFAAFEAEDDFVKKTE